MIALEEAGVDDEWWGDVVLAVDDVEAVLHEALDDPRAHGAAKEVVGWLMEQGYDPSNPSSLAEGIAAWNADPPPPRG